MHVIVNYCTQCNALMPCQAPTLFELLLTNTNYCNDAVLLLHYCAFEVFAQYELPLTSINYCQLMPCQVFSWADTRLVNYCQKISLLQLSLKYCEFFLIHFELLLLHIAQKKVFIAHWTFLFLSSTPQWALWKLLHSMFINYFSFLHKTIAFHCELDLYKT